MTNIAMENGPFIDDFPIKTCIYMGFSMAMLNNQMVNGIIRDNPVRGLTRTNQGYLSDIFAFKRPSQHNCRS